MKEFEMTASSNYFKTNMGNHLLREGVFTKPIELWLALFQTMPNDDGTGGIEVNAAGYSRIPRGPSDAMWEESSSNPGEFKNTIAFEFSEPTENWALNPTYIVAYGIYDSVTGGNLLLVDKLLTPQEVAVGGLPPTISEGNFIINFS
jgi:hypothetical protein